jgi:hypothetical protein
MNKLLTFLLSLTFLFLFGLKTAFPKSKDIYFSGPESFAEWVYFSGPESFADWIYVTNKRQGSDFTICVTGNSNIDQRHIAAIYVLFFKKKE